jgi:hypothetical protein
MRLISLEIEFRHRSFGILHAYRATIFERARDVERALIHARQGIEHAERSANNFQVVIARALLGEALVGNKRWSVALDALAKALELARAVQQVAAQPLCLALLSAARLALGDVGAARGPPGPVSRCLAAPL